MCNLIQQTGNRKILVQKFIPLFGMVIGILVILSVMQHWGLKYYDFGNLMIGLIIGLNISLFSYLFYRIEVKYEQLNKEMLSMISWKNNGH